MQKLLLKTGSGIRDRWSQRPVIDSADESNQGRKHRQNCTLGPRIAVMCESTESAVEKGLALLEEGGLLKIEHRNGGLQTTLLSGGKINRNGKLYKQFMAEKKRPELFRHGLAMLQR